MNLNSSKINSFLKKKNFQKYKLSPLKGDASFRKYYRLKNLNRSFVLSHTDKEKNLNIKTYEKISTILRKKKILVPKVFCSDFKKGFNLIQDLGNKNFLNIINKSKNKFFIYKKIIFLLFRIQKINSKSFNFLPVYNFKLLKIELDLFFDWYLPGVLKIKKNKQITKLREVLLSVLKDLNCKNNTFVHRDFHVSNLMNKSNQIFLIDFQDAVKGHIAYDLASLIDDVRIKTSFDLKKKIFNFYLTFLRKNKKFNISEFNKIFIILTVQRLFKIIGIFSRLSIRDNKKKYLKLIPYTWSILRERLKHPIFNEARMIIRREIDPLLK